MTSQRRSTRSFGAGDLLHCVLLERGDPTVQAYGSPSDALGEAEVQAAGTQRETDAGMATRGPATVSRSVRALGAAIHDLRTGRHKPDEPRGSRPDLWGAAGEIPAAYPAASSACRSRSTALSNSTRPPARSALTWGSPWARRAVQGRGGH